MKTILIADDEEMLRDLVQATLQTPETRILQASDGYSALVLAQREHPDLVLLDIKMPGLDGIQVAQTLLDNPETADIPVIILTGVGDDADRQAGLALGVRAYLMKPFSPLELMQRVEELLTGEEHRKGNHAGATTSDRPATPA